MITGVPTPTADDFENKEPILVDSRVFTLRRPFNLPQLKEAKFEGKDLL